MDLAHPLLPRIVPPPSSCALFGDSSARERLPGQRYPGEPHSTRLGRGTLGAREDGQCGPSLGPADSGPDPVAVDAVAGEAAVHVPAPEPWVPPSSAPREPSSPLPKLEASAPPSEPPAPPAEAEARPKVPRSREAAEKDEGEPGEATGEAAEEDRAPLTDRGPKERPRREGKPRKEKPRKEDRPKKERPRKEERPREPLPRRWESREGSHRPWARDSRDAEPKKRQVWVSPPRPDKEKRPRSRQRLGAGKGRD
ncbi:Junctional sarcoplasmic reticulum protein 1 [Saguinus oedipus]|uniref:Junctional sarcoplasmic reticulum protein 1 n=1 Tax=Saguinus oedipus TaxID=9490 RepID=A0ABQ9TQ84_SAGOE|nr:Junctional sarcoplasmic reticulum protein 1 [Saguinus oedipus]